MGGSHLLTYSPTPYSLLTNHVDIEMKDVLAPAELRVKGDGRRIDVIGLDEEDVSAAGAGDGAQLVDERGGYACAAVRFGDGEVVDVDFAARLLELLQLVGRSAPMTASSFSAASAMK